MSSSIALSLTNETFHSVSPDRVGRTCRHAIVAWTAVRGIASPDSLVPHDGKKSLRVEPSAIHPDAAVRSAPINLTIGKTYTN
jgi:hypothetical protein